MLCELEQDQPDLGGQNAGTAHGPQRSPSLNEFIKVKSYRIFKKKWGWRDAQELRAHTIHTEDPGSIPSTHVNI